MTYKINGITIEQPTSGKWIIHPVMGLDGYGRPIYSAVAEYELTWNVLNTTGMYQLHSLYLASSTGSAIVDLPQFMSYAYSFQSYTGCVLYEPQPQQFFAEYYLGVAMTIGNIKV